VRPCTGLSYIDDDVALMDVDAKFHTAVICTRVAAPMPTYTSVAQRSAPTTLENTARSPSPVV